MAKSMLIERQFLHMRRKEKIAAIIQARMGSTRLPGKVLKDVVGKPMLGHLIDRLRRSHLIDEIVIAATQEKGSSIRKLALECGVGYFAGNEADVLDRYYRAAKEYEVDIIVRITSDCPLIDPEVVDKVVRYYVENKERVDYASNNLEPSYPLGLDTEVFSSRALERDWQEAKEQYQREHVTPYIREHPEIFHLANIENNEDLSYMRWTVDEEKDLEFVREIYGRLYKDTDIFVMADILELLMKEPHLTEINKEVKQRRLEEIG